MNCNLGLFVISPVMVLVPVDDMYITLSKSVKSPDNVFGPSVHSHPGIPSTVSPKRDSPVIEPENVEVAQVFSSERKLIRLVTFIVILASPATYTFVKLYRLLPSPDNVFCPHAINFSNFVSGSIDPVIVNATEACPYDLKLSRFINFSILPTN